jgi:hypothetical protein
VPIAGHFDGHAGQARIETGEIDRVDAQQLTAAVTNLLAGFIQQADTESLRHACAAIVRSRVAAAEEDAFRAGIKSVTDQFADAPRGGVQRIAMIVGAQAQAGSSSHFDDGGTDG